MEATPEDPFDKEFQTIWSAMRIQEIAPLAIAGGYGLLLKQQWLSKQEQPDMLVPIVDWRKPNPRATKDFDLVVDLAFLKDAGAQKRMTGLLRDLGYVVTEKNPRWQFEKSIAADKTILVEFHAEPPAPDDKELESGGVRVKRKPSLNTEGIHAHKNAEAIGCERSPFPLSLHGEEILVPNPVTWAIMKLTAMADQSARSKNETLPQEKRTFFRRQAEKHAEDVCRIVAMTSSGEADEALRIKEALREESAFKRAAEIVAGFFNEDGEGTMMTENSWSEDGHEQIRELLRSWFSR